MARKASRAALEDFISGGGNGKGTRKAVKKVVKKAVAKKRIAKRTPSKRTPVKRTPAKAAPKRSTKAAPKRTTKASRNSDSGRMTIGKVDYSIESEDWQPRAKSPVLVIWKDLKASRDNVDRAFDILLPKVKGGPETDGKPLVHAKKNDGTRRSAAEIEAMLRYRINRTRFEYAVRTGQHESSQNRVEYGTGQYAKAKPKRRGRPPKAQAAPKAAPKRRGRPPGSKNRTTPARRTTVARKRGRPKTRR